MDSSDEGILLSTMSPRIRNKLKPGQKRFRRIAGASILALKSNIRRSSMYEKSVVTLTNNEIKLANSTCSTETCDSEKWNILNKTPIIISDTDETSDEKVDKVPEINPNTDGLCVNNCSLSDEKMNAIECWIGKVNKESDCRNSTFFSELSTIQGDTDGNYVPESLGQAVNSTCVTPMCKRFDELFKNRTRLKVSEESLKSDDNISLVISPENLVIDDSFDNPSTSLITRVTKSEQEVEEISSPELDEGSQTRLNKSNERDQNDNLGSLKLDGSSPEDSALVSNGEDDDMEKILDTLYGHSWRAKKELVLPMTEPRKNKVYSNLPHVTNSERKPKPSLPYKNPFLDNVTTRPNNLLKKKQDAKSDKNVQTPLFARLRELCDSDTDSDNSPDKIVPKTKLSFKSDTSNDDDDDKTSKYFKKKTPKMKNGSPNITDDNEEHDEASKHLNGSSGSHQNKMKNTENGVKVPTSTNSKKYLESCKENIETPIKKTRELKNTHRKQQSVISSSSSEDSNFKIASDTSSRKKPHKIDSNHSRISLTSDEEWEEEISKIDHSTSLVNGTYSFLLSLSKEIPLSKCDMSARIYRNNFKRFREQLTKKLFALYNDNIFEGSLPPDTVLEWNDRLLNTAGQCHCKKIIRRSGKLERSVRIVLSNKVLDSAERLRDTLVHEMCHAATWIVNCVSDGHGTYWKAWAYKAMKTYPELPPISRCHNYVINTKYTYKCTGCGYSIGRHTKSLDVERKRCGYCHGKFEVLINKTNKKGATKSVPATPKKEATGFALFVKQNYGIYKTPDVKHGDVMKQLGQKFQILKLKT